MTQLGGKGALRSNDRKIQNTAPKPSRRAKICDQQQTDEISGLVTDAGIVRHRQKIGAVVANAKLVVQMEKEGESLTDFLWSFVDFHPIQNKHKTMATVQSSTERSTLMSKTLKKRGFKFVGATTCYAFMQASGMVNDHMVSCPGYKAVKTLATQVKRPRHWAK